MNGTFLENIIAAKRKRVALQKLESDFESLKDRALSVRASADAHRLRTALSGNDRTNIIAETKRASPSKGVINDGIDVAATAAQYRDGGAAAISVLTEENYFGGSLDDLIVVRNAVDLPLLRKDFIVDEFQLFESAAAGADMILLIVAVLAAEELSALLRLGRDTLGMDVIVEVHSDEELKVAAEIGADIIGVNNRDLRSFDVSLDVSRDLIRKRPQNALMISESGLSNREQIDELRSLGFDGFLIGESLMRSDNISRELRSLTGEAMQ